MKIILDTNFLLLPAQFKIDIFQELKNNELIIFDLAIRELKKIARSKGKAGINANIALKLIKNKKIKIIKARGKVDKAIIDYAKNFNCWVATNDKKLIKALKKNEIKIIRLRQKKFLVME